MSRARCRARGPRHRVRHDSARVGELAAGEPVTVTGDATKAQPERPILCAKR